MLNNLQVMTLENKEELSAKAKSLKQPITSNNVNWRDYEIEELPEQLSIAAGDGSINRIKYLPFIFYAVSAVSLIFDGTPVRKVSKSEVDIMQHHRYAEDNLRNKMGFFEVQNALELLKEGNIDYYLFDGSILGDIIRPFPKDLEGQKENLGALAELMEYRKNIVAISKTSTGRDFFKRDIPDIAVLEEHSKLEGYSAAKHVSLTESKREFPYRNVYFKNLTFTIFYARLADYKNLLKFELPYKANISDIIRTLQAVKSISAEGYPLLLKFAHNEVVIRKNDIEDLARIVGLMEKKGREML